MNANHMTHEFTTLANRVSRRTALRRLSGAGIAATLRAAAGRDAALAQGTPKPHEEAGAEPNRFVLAGELQGEEVRLTYVATGDSGEPAGTYEGPYAGHASFSSPEASALGRLVTVHLGAFPDQGDFRLVLVLPSFRPMRLGDAPVPFATLAILAVVVSTIAGPPPTGDLEEYRAVMLEGTAEFVAT